MTKENEEFKRFDKTMDALMKVPHDQIKAQLDAEKIARKRKSKTSVSGRASRAKD